MSGVVVLAPAAAAPMIERAVRASAPGRPLRIVDTPAEAARAMAVRRPTALVDALTTPDSVDVVRAALADGTSVVSANAAAVATAGDELESLALATGARLHADAACGGPLVRRVIEEFAVGEGVASIQGCLDPVAELLLAAPAGRSSHEAAAHARRVGVAQDAVLRSMCGDRSADVLAVLARLAFAGGVPRADVAVMGVDWLTAEDASRAAVDARRWRLVATATSACARVEPVPLAAEHALAAPGCRLEVRGLAGSRVCLLLDTTSTRALARTVAADLARLERGGDARAVGRVVDGRLADRRRVAVRATPVLIRPDRPTTIMTDGPM